MMETVPELDLDAYRALSLTVRRLLGIDLDSYKPQQVWRRVTTFARRQGLSGPGELGRRLEVDPALRTALRDLLTINVSEFFRDPDRWTELATSHLAPHLRSGRTIRAWSAGCSFGYEPFSLAMLASEVLSSPAIRILATDIDEVALARTRAGRFSDAEAGQLTSARRDRHFVVDGTGWNARPELRRLVDVRRHDLTVDPIAGPYDLIVCRNLLIYLTEAAKARVYPAFAAALRPGGILFVGGTEIVPRPMTLGLRPAGRCLYVKG